MAFPFFFFLSVAFHSLHGLERTFGYLRFVSRMRIWGFTNWKERREGGCYPRVIASSLTAQHTYVLFIFMYEEDGSRLSGG